MTLYFEIICLINKTADCVVIIMKILLGWSMVYPECILYTIQYWLIEVKCLMKLTFIVSFVNKLLVFIFCE